MLLSLALSVLSAYCSEGISLLRRVSPLLSVLLLLQEQ